MVGLNSTKVAFELILSKYSLKCWAFSPLVNVMWQVIMTSRASRSIVFAFEGCLYSSFQAWKM